MKLSFIVVIALLVDDQERYVISVLSDEIDNSAMFSTFDVLIVDFNDSIVVEDASQLGSFAFFDICEVVATILVLKEKAVSVVVLESDKTGQRGRSIRISARLSTGSTKGVRNSRHPHG